VRRTAKLWTGLRAVVRLRRVQFALSIRVTIAALVSLALAQFLQLPLPLWAVLTAVIVTQMSVGRSMKTTSDYLVGTLGGAIYGGAIGVLIPHSDEIALLAVLALAVAPLCPHRGDKSQILCRAYHRRHRAVGPHDDPRDSNRVGT
jgi:uncharacterized membrane protein YccC